MLMLGMVADETACSIIFLPISHKFMSKLVSFLNPPKEIVDSLVNTAVIDLTEEIPAN